MIGMLTLLYYCILGDESSATLLPLAPQVFRNPEELKAYLAVLNDYYALVGRPR